MSELSISMTDTLFSSPMAVVDPLDHKRLRAKSNILYTMRCAQVGIRMVDSF